MGVGSSELGGSSPHVMQERPKMNNPGSLEMLLQLAAVWLSLSGWYMPAPAATNAAALCVAACSKLSLAADDASAALPGTRAARLCRQA
jgi:hypothetical protein